MPERPLGGPRHWVEFPDPNDDRRDPAIVYRCDLTWLTSSWHCIFGAGCPGIYASRPDDGCCTLGAHYSDDADRSRIEAIAAALGPEHWQLRQVGMQAGVTELDPEGSPKTAVADGACIFLNRPGFSSGPGCALHNFARATGQSLVATKPEVCWQLPIRRSYEEVTAPDGSTYQLIVISEYDRRGWGEGGHDLDWYCTTATEAHTAPDPVYLSCRAELVALIGEPAYEVLALHCRARLAALEHLRSLADGGRDLLPGLAAHPASTR